MKLSHSLKIAIGVATLWLLVYPLLFISAIFLPLLTFNPEKAFPAFGLIFPLHCVTGLLQLGLLVFYLVHIIKKPAISDTTRVLFGLGIFFLSFLVMPLYFYFFIWHDDIPTWARDIKQRPLPSEIEEIDTLKAQEKGTRKSVVPILVIGLALLVILGAVGWGMSRAITRIQEQMMQNVFSDPEAVTLYEELPPYEADELPFYRPVGEEQFTLLNNFKGITMRSDYNQVPLVIYQDDVLLVGRLATVDTLGGINLDLISADIYSGEVNWQARTGSAFLVKDGERIYAEAPNDFFVPAGLAAYEAQSGQLLWETRFDEADAFGLSHVALDGQEIMVETVHHGNHGQYQLNKQNGTIQLKRNGGQLYGRDEEVHYGGLIFQKLGYGTPDSLVVRQEADNHILWRSQERIVSNIAVSGEVTYFLTDKVQLMAVDSYSGEPLGVLSFAPRFPQGFDFVNTSLMVAAEGDIVAIYFEDSQQLSLFQFQPSGR